MRISVIINTYNEGADLERTVRNFREKAGGAELSFVVISDGTTDGSADALDDSVVVLSPETRLGCGQAKHVGVKYALKHQKPDFIFHSDGHARIISGTLEDVAREGMERSPCVITPAVGPLGCKNVPECKKNGRHGIPGKCEVDCPDYADPEGIPKNSYHGGKLGWKRRDHREIGIFCDNTLTRPEERVVQTQVVNPSAFGYTPKTLTKIGGWNRYPGWWGSQEAGISLRCWFSATPIFVLRDDYVCLLHRYRSWNHKEGKALSPYTIPMEHRNVNWRYMHRIVFDAATWKEVWKPWFARLHHDPKANKLLKECEWVERQRKAFRRCKKRTDDEFFQEILGFENPAKTLMQENASRALYTINAGIGNALMCIPAIKALAELSGEPVDVWDKGLHQGEHAVELLSKQPFIRKVIPKAETPDLTWYKYIIGSYWAGGAMFVPKGCISYDVDKAWRTKHEVECNMAAVRKAGYTGVVPSADLEVWDRGDFGLSKDYVAVGIGCAAHESKKYPHWEKVCKQLHENGVKLVFLGGAGDDAPWMDTYGTNLCGKTTLSTAAGALELARLYVGLDNGLSHLAAAVRCPMVTLYGPSSERKNRPWTPTCRVLRSGQHSCAPCWDRPTMKKCQYEENTARPCMKAIRPEYVAGEVLAMLNAPAWAVGETWPLYLSRKQIMENMNATPLQVHGEFSELIDLAKRNQITRIAEIGSADGGWVGIMGTALGRPIDFLCIDPDPNKHPMPLNCPADFPRGFGRVKKMLEESGHRVTHIPKLSGEAVFDAEAWVQEHGLLDLLHIDGNHDMEFCLKDWKDYRRFVRPGGLVVFHDLYNETCPGVKPVFESIPTSEYDHLWTFRVPWGKGRGIGVIRVPLDDAAA